MIKRVGVFCIGFILILAGAGAESIYVDLGATAGAQDGSSWSDAFLTIQEGIDTATTGDEVVVAQGRYYENVVFLNIDITLKSTDPTNPLVVENTIIDGSQIGTVVTFQGGETTDCVLAGFTITNGYIYEDDGAGIYGGGGTGFRGSNALIAHNIIRGNHAGVTGGGVAWCGGTIEYNTITSNTAQFRSGGLYRCRGLIQYNTISNNKYRGLHECHGTIQNNIISDNLSVGLFDCDGVIQNNTISENTGSGLYYCDGMIQNNTIIGNLWRSGVLYCSGTIQHNIVSNNSGGGFIWCDGTIQNNTITGNAGCGISGCDGTIQDNTITGNAGCGISGCDGTIQNNIISSNTAEKGGGLIYCGGTIQNNTITSNTAIERGGGLYRCNGTIRNNTIAQNTAPSGGGLYECDENIINCIIWGNSATTEPQVFDSTTPAYSCIQDWTGGGEGNITSNPLFVDGSYRLQHDSPCIDMGTNTSAPLTDFLGYARPRDGNGDGTTVCDIGAYEYYGPPYTFDFGTEEWAFRSYPAVFTPPTSDCFGGALILTSQSNTDTFGYWISPADAIAVSTGTLYRARFDVMTDIANQEAVPQLRLRANTQDWQQGDSLIIQSLNGGSASPTPAGRSYDLYLDPPDTSDNLLLSFDMINFDPDDEATGSFFLDTVTLESYSTDTLATPTQVASYDFALSSEGWTTVTYPAVFTEPAFSWTPGALQIAATTNTNLFGYWRSPAEISVAADTLYRIRAVVSSDQTDPALVPTFRLRANLFYEWAARVLTVESFADGANSPTTAPKTYDFYFLPPPETAGSTMYLSFDILNFNPEDAAEATLSLESVVIETLDLQ